MIRGRRKKKTVKSPKNMALFIVYATAMLLIAGAPLYGEDRLPPPPLHPPPPPHDNKPLDPGIYYPISRYTDKSSARYSEKPISSENMISEDKNKKKDIREADIKKSRIRRERQKLFLYRVIDDVTKSLSFVLEDIETLESRIESITLLEPVRRESDLTSVKADYESHMHWLYQMKGDFESGYKSYLLDAVNNHRWVERCKQIIENYEETQKQTTKSLAEFESRNEKLVYHLNRQKYLLNKTEEIRDEIAELERKDEVKKEANPEEEKKLNNLRKWLRSLQIEMNALAQYKEELYLHYLLLIEQLKERRDWTTMKIGEYNSLATLAKALGADVSTVPELELKQIITTYEREKKLLEDKIEKLDNKKTATTPYGTLRETDRFQELLDYYQQMKSRYSDYISLLDVQIDGFRTDLYENVD